MVAAVGRKDFEGPTFIEMSRLCLCGGRCATNLFRRPAIDIYTNFNGATVNCAFCGDT